ncbi:MAG: helix-turn-helix domain-containing protein [Peptostreptococcaceae bacterium]
MLSYQLKKLREEKGYSLRDVQLILENKYSIKVSRSSLQRYETGQIKKMNVLLVSKILNIYGRQIGEFMDEKLQ